MGEIPQIALTSLQASITGRTGGESKRQNVNNSYDISNSRATWTSWSRGGVVTITQEGNQASGRGSSSRVPTEQSKNPMALWATGVLAGRC